FEYHEIPGMRLEGDVVEHSCLLTADDEPRHDRNRSGGRQRRRRAGLVDEAQDLAVDRRILDEAAAGELQTARVGPADAEDAGRGGDRIDVHVFGAVVPGELLEHLRVAQDSVPVDVDDAGGRRINRHPASLSNLRALSPVRRAVRGYAESEDAA